MAGVKRRLERARDAELAQAWQTGQFVALAQARKLKPLSHYQKAQRRKAQTPRDMVAMLRSIGAGSDMTIERIKLKD